MSGVLPLTFETIRMWQETMDIGELHPLEVQALLILDAAMITSGSPDDIAEPEQVSKEKKSAWPTKKKGV